jgi:hypothetical protein
LPFLQEIPDPVQRSAWVAEVARRVRVDERSIENRLTAPRAPARPARRPPAAPDPLAPPGPPDEAVAAALAPATAGASAAMSWDTESAALILGHLLESPHRLKEVNNRLRHDGQPPLHPDDFIAAVDRDLLVAVELGALGVPPPDAPAEHRLDSLPDVHAERCASHRRHAAAEPPRTESDRIGALRDRVLHLRLRRLTEQYSTVRFGLAESTPEEQASLLHHLRDLGDRRNAVQRLLTRDILR